MYSSSSFNIFAFPGLLEPIKRLVASTKSRWCCDSKIWAVGTCHVPCSSNIMMTDLEYINPFTPPRSACLDQLPNKAFGHTKLGPKSKRLTLLLQCPGKAINTGKPIYAIHFATGSSLHAACKYFVAVVKMWCDSIDVMSEQTQLL